MGTAVQYIYLAAAASFVIGLHLMNNPATARRGNLLSGGAMAVAVAATVALLISWGTVSTTAWLVIAAGAATGSTAGVYAARRVHLTAMPQLVSLFNAVGGGAAALIAIAHLLSETDPGARFTVPGALDILIGAVAFSGSLVAAGKLQGWVTAHPIVYRGARLLPVVLAAGVLAGVLWLVAAPGLGALLLLTAAALGRRGDGAADRQRGHAGGDLAVERRRRPGGVAGGFVLDELVLVIARYWWAPPNLTKLMAEAMNRSVRTSCSGLRHRRRQRCRRRLKPRSERHRRGCRDPAHTPTGW